MVPSPGHRFYSTLGKSGTSHRMDRSYCAQFVKFIRERFSYSRISEAPANKVAPVFAPALTANGRNTSSVMSDVHCI